MRFLNPLSKDEHSAIKTIIRTSSEARHRARAHAILLSSKKFTIEQITDAFEIDRDTVNNWFRRWEKNGLDGLNDLPKSGRPPKIYGDIKKKIKIITKNNPRSLNSILAILKESYDIIISKTTLRRILKKLKFVWKRMKKSIKSKRNQVLFDKAKKKIDVLIKSHKNNEIKLFYFDQSGFSLQPTVPYGWQEKGKNIEILSQKGGHLNAVGMITPDNEYKSFLFDGTVDSDLIIGCINRFIKYKRKDQDYVIIIDNAPIHRSEKFLDKIPEWKSKNVNFYYLPPYSPELNKIEILWRFIKYTWLEISSYTSKEKLINSLSTVCRKIGTKYRITFG